MVARRSRVAIQFYPGTPLWNGKAVSCNDGAVVSALLDEMADVNARDLGGFTALMCLGRNSIGNLVANLLSSFWYLAMLFSFCESMMVDP